jgi:hypothetical protein
MKLGLYSVVESGGVHTLRDVMIRCKNILREHFFITFQLLWVIGVYNVTKPTLHDAFSRFNVETIAERRRFLFNC